MRNKIFHILFCLLLPLLSLGQASRLPDKSITFKASDISVTNALKAVELKAAVRFSYNPDQVSASKRISVDIREAGLEDALNAILGDGFEYIATDSHIIIKPRIVQGQNSSFQYEISVFNINSGNPVSHVLVKTQNEWLGETNRSGYVSFQLPDAVSKVNLIARGYNDTTLTISAYGKRIVLMKPEKAIIQTLMPVKSGPVLLDTSLNDSLKSRDVERFVSQPKLKTKNFQLSFFPAFGTDFLKSDEYSYKSSFNLIGGTVGGIRGLEIGIVFNHVKYNMIGFQFAGVLNYVNGEMIGNQISPCLNYTGEESIGVQVSGLSNISQAGLQGCQVSAVSNVLVEGTSYAQIAGVINLSQSVIRNFQFAGVYNQSNVCKGVQFAGVANVSSTDTVNVQIAGISNKAEQCRSVQVAPILNNCTRRSFGVQAGLFNIADTAHSQFGLVNYAHHSDGLVMGLFSLIEDGYRALEFSYTESMSLNMQFKSGQNRFYNIINMGLDFRSEEMGMLLGYGVGTNFYFGRNAMLNLDLTSSHILERGEFVLAQNNLLRLESEIGYNLANKVVIYAGPSFNYQVSAWKHPDTGQFLTGFNPGDPFELLDRETGVRKHLLWVGFNIGIRL